MRYMSNSAKKIQSIEPSQEQLSAIENLFYDKALDPKNFTIITKNKKALPANFFLDLPLIKLEDLKKEIRSADYKKVVNKLSLVSHGSSALHFASLNDNPEVFNYLFQYFKDNNIDYNALKYAKESKNVSNSKKYFIFEGDTVFNLALSTGKKILIDNAIKHGFIEISCPMLTFSNRKADKVEPGNVLDFAVSQFSGINNTSSIEHKIVFYTRLALALDSFDNFLSLEPYSEETSAPNSSKIKDRLFANTTRSIGAYYFNLVYCPDLYKNENFVKVFIPTVLDFLTSSNLGEKEIVQDYVYTKESSQLEKTHPFIKAVLTFLESSQFFTDKDTFNKYAVSLGKLLAQDNPFLIYSPEAVQKELEDMAVRREKKLLSHNIEQVIDVQTAQPATNKIHKL